jgi:hypothetical protein
MGDGVAKRRNDRFVYSMSLAGEVVFQEKRTHSAFFLMERVPMRGGPNASSMVDGE